MRQKRFKVALPKKVLFHVKRSPILEAKFLKSRLVHCFT